MSSIKTIPPAMLECNRWVSFFEGLVILNSTLTLVGWFVDAPSLVALVPYSAPMAMSSAFCFLVLALSMAISPSGRSAFCPLKLAIGVLVACIALSVLPGYIGTATDFVDHGLVPMLAPRASIRFPVRMSLITSIGFALMGLGTIADALLRGKGRIVVCDVTRASAVVLGLGSLIGHLYTIPFLQAFGFEKVIATASTLNFILLGVSGFLSRPEEGLMAIIRSPHVGGRFARRFLLIILLLPITLGGAIAILLRMGLFTPSQAILFIVMGTIVFFTGFLIRNAATIDSTETARLKSERRYRELFRNISSGVSVFSVMPSGDPYLVDINESAVRMRCFRKEELVGKRLEEAFPCMLSNGILEAIREVHATGVSRCLPELQCRTPDGDAWRKYCLYALPGGEVVAVCDDMTDRRKDGLERERLEAELAQSQKMEALGRLAGGVAHDFNNILMVIKGYGEMAFRMAVEPMRSQIQEIRNAADRAADLTEQLLLFSRKKTKDPVVVDIGEIIRSNERLLRRLVGEDIELQIHVERNAGKALVDTGSIVQVVMNLAVNARDAMSAGGLLTITVKNRDVRSEPSENGNRWVRIEVSDTGKGMDEATKSRVFEPFFTTKPAGKGTGLGLSIVYGIVSSYGGKIDMASEPGHGTSFSIELPQASECGAGTPIGQDATGKSMPCAGRILVVEDEPAARRFLRDILWSMGYEVLEASGAEEALQCVRRRELRIALVIADVIMPKMGGPELADFIHRTDPTLPFLYISVYPVSYLVDRHGFHDAGVHFLQKPFDAGSLIRAIHESVPADTAATVS